MHFSVKFRSAVAIAPPPPGEFLDRLELFVLCWVPLGGGVPDTELCENQRDVSCTGSRVVRGRCGAGSAAASRRLRCCHVSLKTSQLPVRTSGLFVLGLKVLFLTEQQRVKHLTRFTVDASRATSLDASRATSLDVQGPIRFERFSHS